MTRLRGLPSILGLILVSGLAPIAHADAIIVTRAMKSSTICEVFIDEGRIRVELEIGVVDLQAFRNALPDELLERLGLPAEPLADRVRRFTRQDLVFRADSGEPLAGRIVALEGRPRVVRDEVTGEPLPTPEGEVETVLHVALEYELPGRPEILSIRPPADVESGAPTASIGFVTNHRGLPVNDFRYLVVEETLDLDWEDPWYSRFRNRNLGRTFSAPVQAFLYVEPFEVRVEIVARPRDLQQWTDLGLEGRETLPASEQAALLERIAEFLGSRIAVTIDGEPIRMELDRVHFLRRSLRQTRVIDPPEDLPMISATLGLILVVPIPSLPQEVAMTWGLFSERIPSVPGVATDEAGGLPWLLTADDPVLRWVNSLTNPTIPSFVELATPRDPPGILTWSALIGCGLAAMLALGVAARRRSIGALVAAMALGAAAGAIWFQAGERGLKAEESSELVTGLLANVYRAFDFRGEEAIYDTLARSASGDLLTQVYLETRRALELQSQGGARTKVKEVELVKADARPLDGDTGFEADCTWQVTGSVGHWGHIHQRRNEYRAALTVQPVDGEWKITGLELLDERRL